jgi:hypothetical protein
MTRSQANRLIAAKRGGAILKAPNGLQVAHKPRFTNDDHPWEDENGHRWESKRIVARVP